MTGELAAHADVSPSLIGHEVALAVNVRDQDRAQRLGVDRRDMEGVNPSLAFNKSEHGLFLGRFAKGSILGFAADLAFVGLDNLVGAAERAKIGIVAHGLANAVHHKPRRFDRDAYHAA